MKKHTIFFLCFWTGILSLRAQFTITAIQPPSNFVYEDLWHLNVTGPATSNYDDFIISLRIYDENGVLDVKSNSSAFAFSYLPLYVNKTNLGPLPQFTTLYYNSTQLENIIQAGGYFPPGVYNIQFILLGRPTDGEYSELADYTYQQFVEALWPPTLLTPYDEDTIDTPYPLLTWTPAYFASGGQQILYTLNMVELNVNQNPYMGLTSNPSFFTESGLPGTVLPYPSSANPLETGKRYGWTVVASIDGQPVGYSQYWSFVYWVENPEDTTIENMYFNLIKPGERRESEFLFTVDETIKFQFDQQYYREEGDTMRFLISNTLGEAVYRSWESSYFPVHYGMNRYSIDPCELQIDPQEEYFRLDVIDNKKQVFYMYFKFKPGFSCN